MRKRERLGVLFSFMQKKRKIPNMDNIFLPNKNTFQNKKYIAAVRLVTIAAGPETEVYLGWPECVGLRKGGNNDLFHISPTDHSSNFEIHEIVSLEIFSSDIRGWAPRYRNPQPARRGDALIQTLSSLVPIQGYKKKQKSQ